MLPLSVVLSTYMQLQIDVLLAKEDYSTKLLDSTYDGILSFGISSGMSNSILRLFNSALIKEW